MSPGEQLCRDYEKYAAAQRDGTCKSYKPIPTDPWTIGFGNTGKDITQKSWWTREKAEQRFAHSWATCKAGVLRASPVLAKPENSNRLEAIISFSYNVGVGAYQSSTLRRYVNAARWQDAANEFAKWNHSAGKVVAGLTLRRASEKALFDSAYTHTQTPLPDADGSQLSRTNTGAVQTSTPAMPSPTVTNESAPAAEVLSQLAQLEALMRDFFSRVNH